MSLSDVASIGTLLSAIAVLVSLVFLYFQLRQVSAQVRQTERNQRSIINQGATTRSMQTNSWLCEAHMSEVLTKAMSNPLVFTDVEALQLTGVVRNVLLSFQDALTQHRGGLVDDITLHHAEASLRFWLSVPALRASYKMYASSYASELQGAVDQIIATTPPNPAIQMAARLRTVLAEDQGEKAGG